MKRQEVPKDDDWQLPSRTVIAWMHWIIYFDFHDAIIPTLYGGDYFTDELDE